MDFNDNALRIINANCGDTLKAYLLKEVCNFQINPLLFRAPQGDVERAFAEERARAGTEQRTPEQLLQAFKEDHRILSTGMPAAVRFEDEPAENRERPRPAPERFAAPVVVSPPAALKTEPTLDEPLQAGEFRINGEIYVSIERAAELRESTPASAYQCAMKQKWRSQPNPEGRGRVWLKADTPRLRAKSSDRAE